jgi:NADH:ubiquinone oxidoreductase subunit K
MLGCNLPFSNITIKNACSNLKTMKPTSKAKNAVLFENTLPYFNFHEIIRNMNTHFLIKIICFYTLVAACETLNGIARTVYLNKRLGLVLAKRVSLFPAILLCLAVCYFYIPLIGITSNKNLILLGTSLSIFMLAFDVILARCVMKSGWSAILNELNIFRGNLLGLGAIMMAF